MSFPPLTDPFGRAVLVRVGLVAVAVALCARLGPWVSLGVGLIGAALVASDLVHRLGRLRRRVVQLSDEAARDQLVEAGGPDASLRGLATRVELARESLAQARRKAEHERDDVLGILEATSEGILVLGHQHRIEMLNDAARVLLQPTVDPLGRSLPEVVRSTQLLQFADELRRGGGAARRTIELPVGTERRPVSVSGALVRGDRPRRRAVVVLNDLFEVARLESVRTDFVANVTHEMRSPLASILGYAETLEDDASATPEMRDFLVRILRNARRLDDIIRDLIELSRLEHATAPQLERTDVAELLGELARDVEDAVRDKELSLEVRTGDLPPRMLLDADLLRQALANLLDNAVKYTPTGGAVTLSARLDSQPPPGSGRELVLAVADTGPGIPPDHQARIFERFYRVDTARSRSLGGTGLGLAIVKHAAALHGARVDLESDAEGSRFSLAIPLP